MLNTRTCSSRDSPLDEVNVGERIDSWKKRNSHVARQSHLIHVNNTLVLYSYIESSFRDNLMGEFILTWVDETS